MILADALSSIGSIGSAVAAVAALAAIFFARRTVQETTAGRREAVYAHMKEMRQQAELLHATQAAHERETADREHAMARELWLQRLTQLGRVEEMLGETADIARLEIANTPPKVSAQFGRWTRITGALVRVNAALVILEQLGGPSLPEIKQMTVDRRRMNTPPEQVVGDAMGALDSLLHLSETNPRFKVPDVDGERLD